MANATDQGYEADNPNIELLRLRNFTLGKRLPDKDILGKDAISHVTEIITALVPFVSCITLSRMD